MSNRIVGVILFAFLIFITLKGSLKGYLQVIGLVPGDAAAAPVAIPAEKKSGGGIVGTITKAAKVAAQVAVVAG